MNRDERARRTIKNKMFRSRIKLGAVEDTIGHISEIYESLGNQPAANAVLLLKDEIAKIREKLYVFYGVTQNGK